MKKNLLFKLFVLMFTLVVCISLTSCDAIIEAIFGSGSSSGNARQSSSNALNGTTWYYYHSAYAGIHIYFGNNNVRIVCDGTIHLSNGTYDGTYTLSGDTVTITANVVIWVLGVGKREELVTIKGIIIGNSMSATFPTADYAYNFTRIQ